MVTVNTTFKEISEEKNLKAAMPWLIGNGEAVLRPGASLANVEKVQPTWAAVDMAFGLERLREIALTQETYIYDVYSPDECAGEPDKETVKLIHFPAQGSRRFVILAAGGAYGAVCSLAEAFPAAARLNELGITAFCLNYRTKLPELMPKPLDDLAAGYQYICEHAQMFGVIPELYAVGGFSAGGHLAAAWGTAALGYRKYHLPAPEALFLAYPMINVWKSIKQMQELEPMLEMMFGKECTEEMVQKYNIEQNIDNKYPPVYIVQSEDDDALPFWNCIKMTEALEQKQIAYRAKQTKIGGHGFGLGSACEAAGWLDQAIAFWDALDHSTLNN